MLKWIVAWIGAVVLLAAPAAQAESLSAGLENLYGERGITLDVDRANVPHQAHFTSESLATFGLLARQFAANAADFPAIGTSAGFAYRYDPKLEVFEAVTSNLGSVFVERAHTIGEGKLQFGFSYLYVDFDDLDGDDLDTLTFRGLEHNDCCAPGAPPPSPGDPSFEIDTADLFFEKLALQSHVFFLTATYGLTGWWDVNLLLPVVQTSLDVRARAVLNDESGSDTHFFDVNTGRRIDTRSFDEDKLGVGDLLLRTKALLFAHDAARGAAGLTLRVPTGDEDDFQGLGDTTLTPFLTASNEMDKFEVHASAGLDINFDDADRSRIRYGGGVSYQIQEHTAILLDIVGSSNVVVDRLGVTVPQFVNAPGTSEATPTTLPVTQRFTKNVFTNVVDIAPGVKTVIGESWIGYVTFFVPLTDDGLRAAFIPSAGVQATF
jgi:hypothetical protein